MAGAEGDPFVWSEFTWVQMLTYMLVGFLGLALALIVTHLWKWEAWFERIAAPGSPSFFKPPWTVLMIFQFLIMGAAAAGIFIVRLSVRVHAFVSSNLWLSRRVSTFITSTRRSEAKRAMCPRRGQCHSTHSRSNIARAPTTSTLTRPTTNISLRPMPSSSVQ